MTLLDDCTAAYMAHTAPNRSVKSMKADPRGNIEAIIAPAVARIAELEAAIRKWLGECGDCDGTGLVAFNYWDHERQISPSDKYPCHACADIRALLPTERTA